MSEQKAHKWAAVAIAALTDEDARRLAAMPILERLDNVCDLFTPPPGELTDVWAVRGPICSDCRVSWEDVDRIERAGQTWPCPGRRPDGLGGPLGGVRDQTQPRPTRQQRRAAHRDAVKASPDRQRLSQAVQSAMREAKR